MLTPDHMTDDELQRFPQFHKLVILIKSIFKKKILEILQVYNFSGLIL